MSQNHLPPIPSLAGRVIRSERQLGVYYLLERCVGEGGMGAAYLAQRKCAEGAAPVVVKVMHNDGATIAPEILAVKEAVALGRLNEQLPPCPFVVRLVDTGMTRFGGAEPTPWVAIEYVHGGVEGTTLEDRVTYSLHRTGYAFDPGRAAHLVRCLTTGLSAIHDVSVLHRDLTPGNVLCCGFGEAEIFKIADFGVARPAGLADTFVGFRVGTPGYVAPDASDPLAGPSADVFSLAAVLYYVLTGQRYFEAESPEQALAELTKPARRSITEHATLAPELSEHPEACQALDTALAHATHPSPALRVQTALEFARATLPWLGGRELAAPRSIQRRLSAVLGSHRPLVELDHRWTVRSHPHDDMVLASAAWDADGHALGLSAHGAWFWNGQVWVDASRLFAPLPAPPAFVQRYEAGGWLVGGRGCHLCVIDASGLNVALPAPSPDCDLTLASGRVGDLLVAVESRAAGGPLLWCSASSRWLRPLSLPSVAQITSLQRLDDTRWLLGGRLRQGVGFAAIYSPLMEEVKRLEAPELRAFIGGASAAERGVAMLVGSGGIALRLDADAPSISHVPGNPDLAAAAVDVMDYEWATSVGQIFGRDRRVREAWRPHWRDPSWDAPFISLMADVGWVLAMTADGAILEGKSD
jgi:serine/threonine protein kinase